VVNIDDIEYAVYDPDLGVVTVHTAHAGQFFLDGQDAPDAWGVITAAIAARDRAAAIVAASAVLDA
jgi:hypothetical protein